MRLSRKVLAGLAGISGLAIMGALIWALDSSRRGAQPPRELFNTANKTTPDGLAALRQTFACSI
jgi:type IV secretion system protein VirB10